MMWSYCINHYIGTHCVARGLRASTLKAYEETLKQFSEWVRVVPSDSAPDRVTARDVLAYLQHLRTVRDNGDAAVNRVLTIIRQFDKALVAMGDIDHAANPMVGFPIIKGVPRKLPVTLTPEEVSRLLVAPDDKTIIGLRDRSILSLLYGTGIRRSECASLTNGRVDLKRMEIRVIGKGGHERVIAFNPQLALVLQAYLHARGPALPTAPFFRSRSGKHLTRAAVYDRVRYWGRKCHIGFVLSPHKLRHTCATHLVRKGVGIVTIRDLLGHRQITSTQIYLHVTAEDLRNAAAKHPIAALINTVEHLLPAGRLPFQKKRAFFGSG
jgi:site-specific recombinase XerD